MCKRPKKRSSKVVYQEYLGLTQKTAFVCGSIVLYVYGVLFFALQGEK
jgi:hypothetical protein